MEINKSLNLLLEYVEKKDYTGYDLYDGLKITNSELILNNYFLNTAITQLFKKNPINLRKFSGIKETKMPKGMGIFLNAYSNLAASSASELERKNNLDKAESILLWLDNNIIEGYSGNCWNFGFNYKFMFDMPTVVITSIVAKGLHNYYSLTGSEAARRLLLGIEDFIIKDLPLSETKDGICFSYTPQKKDTCFNASMLAAETLARIYSISRNESLLDPIKKAVDFTLAYQKKDGRWNYSIDLISGNERPQVDFHQGYVLESLFNIMRLSGLNDQKYRHALEIGSDFYLKEQFFADGQSKWRIPKIYPVDIHNQAQGIITFHLLKDINPAFEQFSKTIAAWTIENMQDEKGFFYYQLHKRYKNRIPYMRWGQAWMLLALSGLKTE